MTRTHVHADQPATTRRPLTRRALTATLAAGMTLGTLAAVAPAAGAQEHEIGGAIRVEYHAAAQANGQSPEDFFGPALSPEKPIARDGRYQVFQNDQSIYWAPGVAGGRANQIGGAIRDRWADAEWEVGPLGYPTTREWSGQPSSRTEKVARGNHFEGGTIYAVPDEGTFVTWGLIRDAWWGDGAEVGSFGLPVGPEESTDDGWVQEFEGGTIRVTREGRVSFDWNYSPDEEPSTPSPEAGLGDQLADMVSGWIDQFS